MGTHFEDPFANWLAVAEIALFGRPDTMGDPGASYSVFQVGKPSIKLLGAQKGVHMSQRIRSDTDMQSYTRGRVSTV
ncbi:hypothetical protein THIX_20344 [Thiomonas sp. X19]|nr:hypothetical protein THIX_20344 [Thiomonas sp. X19]